MRRPRRNAFILVTALVVLALAGLATATFVGGTRQLHRQARLALVDARHADLLASGRAWVALNAGKLGDNPVELPVDAGPLPEVCLVVTPLPDTRRARITSTITAANDTTTRTLVVELPGQ